MSLTKRSSKRKVGNCDYRRLRERDSMPLLLKIANCRHHWRFVRFPRLRRNTDSRGNLLNCSVRGDKGKRGWGKRCMAGFLHDICMVVRRRKLLVGLRILRVIAHGTRPQGPSGRE